MPLDPNPPVLPVLPNLPPSAFEAKDLFKIGNYAIGLRWGDGHDTGIYPFDYLRKICPCQTCLANSTTSTTFSGPSGS